ncbi:MAG: hypothetical protein OXP28_03280 [Gammaproteobacteria bacterium]|nr:hypothetical protein [Gammaproteobacteria bacterium]MDE0224141.1 hypothetical protein [Gammaproteobacteria bacterium]MDE0451189.1 hypothetical protein [Gammaproteobacteria bacterium]
MKAAREHRVPLSDRTLAVLDEARKLPQAHNLYRRSGLFERRRTLMQEWADYVRTTCE